MTLFSPTIGPVLPLSGRILQKKVRKHLYSPTERWDTLLGVPVHQLVEAAARAGIPPFHEEPSARLEPAAQALLQRHHDSAWLPAYSRDLGSDHSLVGKSLADGRWVIASPRGVYLVTGDRQPPQLISVHRPHPPFVDVEWTEEQFAEQARWRWEKETGMSAADLSTRLAREPRSAGDVWLLALAISDAVDAQLPELQIAEARSRVAKATPDAQKEATPLRERVLDELERSLREGEDGADVLMATEGALRVLEVLGHGDVAQDLAERAADLVDWAPQPWWRLGTLAAARVQTRSAAAALFWDRVQASLDALLLEHIPANEEAQAASTAPWYAPIAAALEALGGRVVEFIGVQHGWSTAQVHASGAGGAQQVFAPRELASRSDVRLFVIDPRESAPIEMTTELRTNEVIWELDSPGDEIRVLVIEHATADGRLAELLAQAREQKVGPVQVVRISRPK